MTDRPHPQIFLKQNPWSQSIKDGVVLQKLQTTAHRCEELIRIWVQAGSLDADKAFALVILDPTNPRGSYQRTIYGRIMAVVLFGDEQRARTYLPNAIAKADATDRHGIPNGELVDKANFCLGDDDFAWGGAVTYYGAIAGGSGFAVLQDTDLSQQFLITFMLMIRDERTRWLEERRRSGKHGWYNHNNGAPTQYEGILDRGQWVRPSA